MTGLFSKSKMPATAATILLFSLFFNAVQAQTYNLNGLWARKTGVFAPNSGISVTQMIADNAGNVYIYVGNIGAPQASRTIPA